MQCKITKVILDPKQRKGHIKNLLRIDGLKNIKENPNGCYCALPLTGIPENQREKIEKKHEIIKQCIKDAGLQIFDPKDAPGNPWHGLRDIRPEQLYDTDIIQLVTPRFFEFTNVAATTGGGIELQKAITYNNITVVVVKKGVFTSRMSTGARRIILIEYNDLEKEREDIKNVFLRLKQYEPCIGECSVHGNTLLGFKDDKVVCLKGLIEEKFPGLVYDFDIYLKNER